MKRDKLIVLLIFMTFFNSNVKCFFYQKGDTCTNMVQTLGSDILDEEEAQYDLKLFEKNNTGNSGFGYSIANAGDVNGDGHEDIVVGIYNYQDGMKAVYVFYGGMALDSVPDVVIKSEISNSGFGYSVSSAGDINNDGFDDVIVGGFRSAFIYLGGEQMDNNADVQLVGEDNGSFGTSVSSAGDINNDGDDDVIIGAEGYSEGVGRAYIYFGGTDWDSIADVVLQGEEAASQFGTSVASAGDVNNDGIDDLIVGASGYFNGVGRAYVYFGGSPVDSIADIVLEGENPKDYFGVSVSTAGDLNNDGTDDVAIGASGKGAAYVYLGSNNMDSISDFILYGDIEPGDMNRSSSFGKSIASLGDANSDNIDDLVVSGRDTYYFNHTEPLSSNRSYVFYGGGYVHNYSLKIPFGVSVSGGGDYNGDSINDIVVGDNTYFRYSSIYAKHTGINTGRVNIYYGSSTIDNKPDLSIDGEGTDNKYGYCINSAGDLNNDGYDDVIIGANGYNERTGRAYIYLGGDTVANTPDIILEGEKIKDQFGISVSTAGDVNNDGYDDIIVGANNYGWYIDNMYMEWEWEMPGKGAAYLFYGGETMDSIADIVFTKDVSGYENQFGYHLASMGDVNNDGYDDVFIGAKGLNKGYLFYGGDTMNNEVDQTFDKEKTGASLGDINGDGVDDFSVGANVYFGSETDVDFNGDLAMPTSFLHRAGDLNNDDIDDVIGLINNDAYVFYGSRTMDTIPDLNIGTGTSISSAGDINFDGFDDVIVGQEDFNLSTGKVSVYCGGTQMDSIADMVFVGEKNGGKFGGSVALIGDVNNDGYSDILSGAYQNEYNGAAYLYFGKEMILFNKHPENITICEGDTACFSVMANEGSYFQWQVSADSGVNFKNISDNGIYSGSQTADLQVVSSKILDNFIHRCKATKDEQAKNSEVATFLVNSRPSAKLTGGGTVCAGDSARIQIELQGKAPWNIDFSDGEIITPMQCFDSLLTFYTDSSGFYKIVKLNDYHCPATNIEGEVAVIMNAQPTANLVGGDTICEGDTILLNVNLTGMPPWTYWLANGDSSWVIKTNNKQENLAIVKEGSYKIVALNDASCEGVEMKGEASVLISPLPAGIFCGENSFCAGDTREVCAYFSGMPPWKFTLTNGGINMDFACDETPYYFNLDSVGIYEITSITDAKCTSNNTCGKITVQQCTNVEENIVNGFELYPNPTEGVITVGNIPDETMIEIVSLSGEVVYKNIIMSGLLNIDLSIQPKGIYFLRLMSKDKISVSKIILK